jgi:hypothetical protein
MPDYTSFPYNELGEPLMDAAAWRLEQSLDAESAYYETYEEQMERYQDDIADDPNYCEYHDALHRTEGAKKQCRDEQFADEQPDDDTCHCGHPDCGAC